MMFDPHEKQLGAMEAFALLVQENIDKIRTAVMLILGASSKLSPTQSNSVHDKLMDRGERWMHNYWAEKEGEMKRVVSLTDDNMAIIMLNFYKDLSEYLWSEGLEIIEKLDKLSDEDVVEQSKNYQTFAANPDSSSTMH